MNKTISALAAAAALWTAAAALADDFLPGHVLFHLKETERIVERAEKTLEKVSESEPRRTRSLNSAQIDLDMARAKMAAMEQRFSGEFPPFHPEVTAVYSRIAALEDQAKKLAAEQKAAELAAAPAPAAAALPAPPAPMGGTEYWRNRMRPAVTRPGEPGFDPESYLEPHATSDPEQMQRRLEIYSKAAATLTEFRQAHFGGMPTVELQQLALDIESALRRFGLSCLEHADAQLADADVTVGRMERFVAEQNLRLARAQPIDLLDRNKLDTLDATLARAARLVRSDDPCLTDLRTRLVALKRHDARLRAARAADTLMRPNAYAGDDAVLLSQMANRAVLEHQKGIRILRTSLISPAWRTESYAEWADFRQSVLQQRVVRTMTAHVAAQYNAETRLYTVELRQDQLPSGMWGRVVGQVKFVDPMLLSNVK